MTEGARVQDTPLSLDALIAETDRPDCGALATFTGIVRNHQDGRAVTKLIYTAHVPIAEKMIRAIEADTAAVHNAPVVRVTHRIGELAVGEAAIVAVARAAHRAEAFDAVRAAVDSVKHQVPIWKEEFFADGTSEFVPGCSIGDGAPAS